MHLLPLTHKMDLAMPKLIPPLRMSITAASRCTQVNNTACVNASADGVAADSSQPCAAQGWCASAQPHPQSKPAPPATNHVQLMASNVARLTRLPHKEIKESKWES
eukprot:CAMPEP_0202888442 /NCGR_PEP_ID=MMETSP1391-20130828/43194_1 /ASSEMBLY_ACC=CAM_ASM_000867 /TAXON_ID=1034604 /ORGANISM="Chlamydomonas leiostraca, Strain SAG 11-49" /LENGTH=105 /DNA_ID=CAMNT_0049571745 /DNA_START=1036 /DNA_END=1353 /DNA_ORIENTATION=-